MVGRKFPIGSKVYSSLAYILNDPEMMKKPNAGFRRRICQLPTGRLFPARSTRQWEARTLGTDDHALVRNLITHVFSGPACP